MPTEADSAKVSAAFTGLHAFTSLQEDISRFHKLGQMILMGDFNARVGSSSLPNDVFGQVGPK